MNFLTVRDAYFSSRGPAKFLPNLFAEEAVALLEPGNKSEGAE
jgi:hypothetical protein